MVMSSFVIIATIYTNLLQIINVPLTRNVVTNFPIAEYSSPHKTLLSFNRAVVLGDFTNMYYCCSANCNQEDLEFGDLSEVPDEMIRNTRNNAGRDPVQICVRIVEQATSPQEYKATCLFRALRSEKTNSYERVLFALRRYGADWKIEHWETRQGNPPEMSLSEL